MDNSNGTPGSDSTADAARRVKESAQSAFDRGSEIAEEKLEQGAEKVASSAHAAATTLRRAAADIQGEHAWIGAALLKSADGLDTATTSLASGDLNGIASDVSGFARRQPAVFLGASLALGFALARVGKTAIEQSGEGLSSNGLTHPGV